MKLDLLKELTQIHSVSGNEWNMENFLVDFAKRNNFKYIHDKWYWVVIWNPLASIYCIAHIDEVWGVIISKKDWNIKFRWVGRVYPDMFVWRDVEILTKNNVTIPWIVLWTKPLFTWYKRFWDLKVFVWNKDYEDVSVWDYLRWPEKFVDRWDAIFANALDNRIWVFALLSFILNNKTLLDKVAFCFATEEEVKNKWAKFYMNKYLPKDILIFDMVPSSLLAKWQYSTDTFILESSLDYSLNKDYKAILKKYDNVSYINSKNRLLKNSEPYQYQKITWWIWMNILCPILNYHSWTYLLEKKSLENYLNFSYGIIKGIAGKG